MTRLKNQKVTIKCILAVTDKGEVISLNINKITIIDKETNKPIFEEQS